MSMRNQIVVVILIMLEYRRVVTHSLVVFKIGVFVLRKRIVSVNSDVVRLIDFENTNFLKVKRFFFNGTFFALFISLRARTLV